MTRPNSVDLARMLLFGGMRHIPAEHRTLVAKYRYRKKIWTLEWLPTMPADQWKQFMAWVSAFGKV